MIDYKYISVLMDGKHRELVRFWREVEASNGEILVTQLAVHHIEESPQDHRLRQGPQGSSIKSDSTVYSHTLAHTVMKTL